MSKEIEIIKQLYDIGKLFNHIDNLDVVNQSYKNTVVNEICYRKKTITANDVLDDIFHTALTITLKGTKDESQFNELMRGIQNIESFIYNENFRLEQAIVAAGKAAYLAQLLKRGLNEFVRFTNNKDLGDKIISNSVYTKLNKLKKTSPEAFFYWLEAIELVKLSA